MAHRLVGEDAEAGASDRFENHESWCFLLSQNRSKAALGTALAG
jgi:hypothetical protein